MGFKEDIRHAGVKIKEVGSELAVPATAGLAGFSVAEGNLLAAAVLTAGTGVLILQDRKMARRREHLSFELGGEAYATDHAAAIIRQLVRNEKIELYTSLDGEKRIKDPDEFINALGSDVGEIMSKTEAIVNKAQEQELTSEDVEYLRMLFSAAGLFAPLALNLSHRNDGLVRKIGTTIEIYEEKYRTEHPSSVFKESNDHMVN